MGSTSSGNLYTFTLGPIAFANSHTGGGTITATVFAGSNGVIVTKDITISLDPCIIVG
jgi:hypothetical protein